MRRSRMLATVAIAVGLALGLVSPAVAGATNGVTSAEPEASVGTVELYGSSPATPVWRTVYATCTAQQAYVHGAVQSFANMPATGCQVVLVKDGRTFELCVGRGVVPAAFQTSPVVRIEAGASAACRGRLS